jgi:opine dehydrogenase
MYSEEHLPATLRRRKHSMSEKTRYAVIGAGHGGKAMAAHLALMGFPVALYNRTPENVAAIKERGGIGLRSYEGGPHGFGELALVTSDMGKALQEADVIMVVVPSMAHRDIARKASRHLRDGQIVVLNLSEPLRGAC